MEGCVEMSTGGGGVWGCGGVDEEVKSQAAQAPAVR